MKIPVSGLVILALSLLPSSPASGAGCNPEKLVADAQVSAPSGATLIRLVTLSPSGRTSNAGFEGQVSGGSWTPDAAALEMIGKKVQEATGKGFDRNQLALAWIDSSGSLVGDPVPFRLSSDESEDTVCPPAKKAKTAAGSTDDKKPSTVRVVPFDECRTAAKTWYDVLLRTAKDRGESQVSVVVFLPTGQLCFRSPGYAAVGDEINVGIARYDKDEIPATVTFEPCALEPDTFSVKVSDAAAFSSWQQQSTREIPQVNILQVSSRRCFSKSVLVTCSATVGTKTQEGKVTLDQYNRYRATLQLGVLYTDQHPVDFGLRDKGGQMVVYDKGPVGTGPEYTASLVIYSLPRYLKSIFSSKTHFAGRDILHDNGFLDRVGGTLTVGLDDLGSRFGAGLSFEVVAGINVVGVWEYAKLDRLVGLSTGDPFTGKESDIPTRKEWENDFTVGLSVDLRYVTALFQRK